MRRAALWIFGLLAGGIFGGLVATKLDPYGLGGLFGFIGGMCAFACARLWLGERAPVGGRDH